MASDRNLEYVIKLKNEATAVWKKFSDGVTKETDTLGSTMKNLGSIIGGAFTVGAVASFMKDAAAAQAEVTRLDQTLKQQGITQDGVKESMLAYSDALKDKTAFDDDEITHLQATMLAMTGNLDAVKKLTPAVLDLARGTGMSTEAAAKMFSKSVEGAEGLKKLGITIGETANETDRFNAIYDAINKKYGGQAAAWAETDAGKMQRLTNAMDDAGKSIGGMFNKIIMPLLPALQSMVKWVTDWAPRVVDGIKILFAGLITAVITPIALIENKLNELGLSSSTYFQGLARAGSSLIGKSMLDIHNSLVPVTAAMESATGKANEHAKAVENTKDKLARLKKELDDLNPGTAEYSAKMLEVTKVEKLYSDATDAAKRATGNLKDELGFLKKDLDSLVPGSDAYGKKMMEIIRIENQFEVATENAKRAAKGFADTGIADIKFNVKMSTSIGSMDKEIAEVSEQMKKSMLQSSSGMSLSDLLPKGDSMSSFKLTPEVDPAKMDEYSKSVDDQVSILAEITEKKYLASFTNEKDRELDVINEWEKKAVDMAGSAEDMITDIRKIAADERMDVEIKAAQKAIESVNSYAQRGVSVISKFAQQAYQAEINTLEKKKQVAVKAIDEERQAVKDKYAELLDNDNLTAIEKTALKKAAEEEDAAILKRKTDAEEEYDNKIRAGKRKAFEAQKEADIIAAIMNTAVGVAGALPNIPLSIIVAALGAAEVAIIASQPVPNFHIGGGAFFDASPSEETTVKIRGQEHLHVTTPEQEAEKNNQRGGGVSVTINMNSSFTPVQEVRRAVIEAIRQTGLTADRIFVNQNRSIVVMQ